MIDAVVPAAGLSARMGQPKLLMKFEGETLIHRVVTALRRGGAGRVVVVAPPATAPEGLLIADEARRAGAAVIVPETRPAEMRLSVELGLTMFEAEPTPQLVFLTPGDIPGITPDLVARLRDAALGRPGCIVAPEYEGRRGHPLVLPWSMAIEIRTLPAGEGVNALVARYKDRLIEVPVLIPDALIDLDTPEDLHHWRLRRAGGDSVEEASASKPLDRSPRLADTMKMRVRLFAMAKDRVGQPEICIELSSAATVADLRAALRAHSPELGPLWSGALIAVDEEYASDDVPIAPDSQLAVIPPVSGGAGTNFRIVPPETILGILIDD
jgi:molybdenum cofactor cytidylyltransferase